MLLTILLVAAILYGILLTAYCLANRFTGFAWRMAFRFNIVSPVTSRSSHTTPTPRLGGIGLAMGLGLGSLLCLACITAIPSLRQALSFKSIHLEWLALGWLAAFLVGLADDFLDLRALPKLAMITGVALLPVLAGGTTFEVYPFPSGNFLANPVVVALLSISWIVFFMNAFNFMDGMDGNAASFACLASVFLFLNLLLEGIHNQLLGHLHSAALLLPILMVTCWGFLKWNAPPALIFMGDSGSLSLGYLFALMVIAGQRGDLGPQIALPTSLTILMPFIFDVVLTLLRRVLRGENLLRAHREHLFQRLILTGKSHGEVLRITVVQFVICNLFALAGTVTNSSGSKWICLGLSCLIMIHYWRYTVRQEAAHSRRVSRATPNQAVLTNR